MDNIVRFLLRVKRIKISLGINIAILFAVLNCELTEYFYVDQTFIP